MFSILVILASFLAVGAFNAPSTRSSVRASLKMFDEDRSIALPFDKRPPNLDGTLPGDVGFDPAGFSNVPPKPWLIGGEGSSLKWYREAEIVHGRVAMLGVLGMIIPYYYHFPGNEAFGVAADAFAKTNPYEALTSVPAAGLWQIAAAIYAIELYRIKRVIRGDKAPGDLGLGQTGYNPFGFEYTEEEYFEKQVQEIKHGRLAMFAILAELLQARASGVGTVDQLAKAFSWPSEREILEGFGNLNDFFPPNL
jgi:hypothetical protein